MPGEKSLKTVARAMKTILKTEEPNLNSETNKHRELS